jgi:hypothetical protein
VVGGKGVEPAAVAAVVVAEDHQRGVVVERHAQGGVVGFD